MPNMETVMKWLDLCSHPEVCCDKDGGCPYWIDVDESAAYEPQVEHCIDGLLRGALALLREREPRVMAMSEVKRIGADNHSAFKNDGTTVMWLEEFGKQYPLHVVVLKWDEDDWQGEPNSIVNVYYFGTDEFDQFSLTDYNKTWRCWTDKPTKTQRMGAAWYA